MLKRWKDYRGDLVGGVTVAVVALPLALAFGIGSGAGAAAGLYGAIFAGFVAAVFGGSPVQVTGPTGPMIMVLISITSRFGLQGMFAAAALAGMMQILLGLAGLGRLVRYLPQPVIAGFTHGVAIIIFAPQIKDALANPIVAVTTIVAIIIAQRYIKAVPSTLFGLAIGIVVNSLFVHTPHIVGAIPSTLPRPSLPLMPLSDLVQLLLPALTICLLGSVESLLSAEVADNMTGEKHDSRRELIGQGLANITSALMRGLPVSGAIARTAVNINAGGRTRLSGIIHSLVLLLMVLLFGKWASEIPLAALAAILMVTAVQMIDWENLSLLNRTSWHYTATLVITMVVTVVRDLTVGIGAGVLISALFVVVDLTRVPLLTRTHGQRQTTPLPTASNVNVFKLSGPLFFPGVNALNEKLQALSKEDVHVIDFTQVSNIDESVAFALLKHFEENDTSVYLGGLQKEPLRLLIKLGVLGKIDRHKITKNLSVAFKRAEAEALRIHSAA